MKLIAVAAISKNRFLTNGNDPDPTKWTSAEDKEFFKTIRNEHKLFVMGKNTYEAAKPTPSVDKLRIVLTNNPEYYADDTVEGQLEFHNLTPEEFVVKYENTYDTCLILGGAKVYEEFLKANLIDEFYLTIEPIEFSDGIRISSPKEWANLKLVETKQLNKSGTFLKHYEKNLPSVL